MQDIYKGHFLPLKIIEVKNDYLSHLLNFFLKVLKFFFQLAKNIGNIAFNEIMEVGLPADDTVKPVSSSDM